MTVIDHPAISGRYSRRTAQLPAPRVTILKPYELPNTTAW